jgi:hypothetical protein
MLLGHQTYLTPKGIGENRMSGKAGCGKTAKPLARRGPDGMVKAGLPEPQCPSCKRAGPIRRETSDFPMKPNGQAPLGQRNRTIAIRLPSTPGERGRL